MVHSQFSEHSIQVPLEYFHLNMVAVTYKLACWISSQAIRPAGQDSKTSSN
jgi:hypothetical protein